MNKIFYIILLLFILIVGCDNINMFTDSKDTKQIYSRNNIVIQNQQRIIVTRIGVIHDNVAYDNIRGIYIITDTKTGKEYIGVSGIGITETGSHIVGKIIRSDER